MTRFIRLLFFLTILPGFNAAAALDNEPLRHGATCFMNYCSGCHALKYLTPERMTADLGDSFVVDVDVTTVSLPESDAMSWFGRMPPDLSLTARARGVGWLRAYLNGFYADTHRPFGTNNTIIPNVAMPNVFVSMTQDRSLERLRQKDVDAAIEDIVMFLSYTAEPAQLVRYRIGLAFLVFLFIMLLFGRWIHRLKHASRTR